MLKRVFPGAWVGLALGVAVSGYPVPEFGQNLPARCMPQEVDASQETCNGIVRFGMNGPALIPGHALDVEATGSIAPRGNDDAAGVGGGSQ